MSDIFHRVQGLITKLHTDSGDLLTTTERQLLREAEQATFRYDHLVNFLQNDVRAYDNVNDVMEAAKGIVERNQLQKHAAEQLQNARDQRTEVHAGQDVDTKPEPETVQEPDVYLTGQLDMLDEFSARYDAGQHGEIRVNRDIFEKHLSRSGRIVVGITVPR